MAGSGADAVAGYWVEDALEPDEEPLQDAATSAAAVAAASTSRARRVFEPS